MKRSTLLLPWLAVAACGHLELGGYPDAMTGAGGSVASSNGGAAATRAGAGGTTQPPSNGGTSAETSGGSTLGEGGSTPIGEGGQAPAFGGSGGVAGSSASGGSTPTAGATDIGGSAGAGGATEVPVGPPSCDALLPTCGPTNDEDCCASATVEGGRFQFGGKEALDGIEIGVSGFRLDKYEVSVGRFRAFLAAYDGWRVSNPVPGAGAHPLLAASGWRAEWSSSLASSAEALEVEARTCAQQPFATLNGEEPNVALNCITWLEAQAFCIWDGGRLPSEAEWEYAAAGGEEARLYPWGDSEPDLGRAIYGCHATVPAFECSLPAVGSQPRGRGRWGHYDLAGSMAEWLFDVTGSRPVESCDDCPNVEPVEGSTARSVHGGAWLDDPPALRAAARIGMPASLRLSFVGLRCARDD